MKIGDGLSKKKIKKAKKTSDSASTPATASTTTSDEIEELEQKLLNGEDFSLKELTETQLDVLCQIFLKYLITSSLKLAKDIIPSNVIQRN